MKKLLALILMMTLGVFAMCGCGEQDVTPSGGEIGGDNLSAQLVALFHDTVAANPEASGDEIADMMIFESDLLSSYDLSTYNMIDTEFMVGFDADFTPEPFVKATYFQNMGSGSFLAYVYQLADNSDTKAFADYLLSHADNQWNGEVAEQTAAAADGDLVFFVMLSEQEAVDYNQQLVDRFQAYMSEESDTSAESIAAYICGIENFPLELSAAPVEAGWLAGLEEFDNFTDGASFAPMIGSIPFMGYVFLLDAADDAEQVVETIKNQANLAWNVCTEADVLLTSTYRDRGRNAVLVVMAPETY